MNEKQPRIAHKNRPFDKLRRMISGKPWSERNASEKVKAVVVDTMLFLMFGVPILLAIFGSSWDAVKDTAFGTVLLTIGLVAILGGMILGFVLWIIGKFR